MGSEADSMVAFEWEVCKVKNDARLWELAGSTSSWFGLAWSQQLLICQTVSTLVVTLLPLRWEGEKVIRKSPSLGEKAHIICHHSAEIWYFPLTYYILISLSNILLFPRVDVKFVMVIFGKNITKTNLQLWSLDASN